MDRECTAVTTIIDKPINQGIIKINGRLFTEPIVALIDTGCAGTLVHSKYLDKLGKITPIELIVRTASGESLTPIGTTNIELDLENKGIMYNINAIVLDGLQFDIILGTNFLSKYAFNIDFSCNKFYNSSTEIIFHLDKTTEVSYVDIVWHCKLRNKNPITIKPNSKVEITVFGNITIPHTTLALVEPNEQLITRYGVRFDGAILELNPSVDNVVETQLLIHNLENNYVYLPRNVVIGTAEPNNGVTECLSANNVTVTRKVRKLTEKQLNALDLNPNLKPTELMALQKLLKQYGDCFAYNHSDLGTCTLETFKIDTGSSPPIHCSPYRYSPKEKEIIKTQVAELLEAGIIEPSNSPWSSPVILVPKKNGKIRMVVDYRKLNHVTKKDVYPLTRIDDFIDSLNNASVFTSLDLYSGYHQCAIDEKDREKSAFIVPEGLYQYNKLSFGLCNAPAFFSRIMNNAMAGLTFNTVLVYLDDLVVPSKDFDNHLVKLEKVLKRIRFHNLSLNPEKCSFGYDSIKILGHVVDKSGVKPDPDKVSAVKNIAVPKTVFEARRFHGMASYYRKFCPNFSMIARPLTSLWKKNATFRWGDEEQQAFDQLKLMLTQAPCLHHHNPDLPQVIHTDASRVGLGATLLQLENGNECPVAYASRTLTDAEKRYSITELECLSLVYAVRKFREYIFGAPFTIKTDHHALCWLRQVKDPTARLARFALQLQPYQFTIAYKSGKLHLDADCLSRSSPHPGTKSDEEADNYLPYNQIDAVDLKSIQRSDLYITEICNLLTRDSSNSKLRNFTLVNDVLYYRDPRDVRNRLVIPKDLQEQILLENHDYPLSGHLGFVKTYIRIKQKYFWPSMRKDILQYVLTCQDCQSRKNVSTAPAGLLQPIRTFELFERIGLDLLGPFPLSQQNENKYLIVATDYVSKYVFTKPIKTKEADNVALFLLHNIVCTVGAPRFILTDRGKEFMACVVLNLLNLIGTTKQTTTAYHPACNGLTERANRTFATMMSMYTNPDSGHKDWDLFIPHVTFAYNTTVQKSIGHTPYFMLYGREALQPIDVTLLPHENVDRHEEIEKLRKIRINVLGRIDKSQKKMSEHYNQSHTDKQYEVGDVVRVYTPIRKVGLSDKLLSRFFGPYKIVNKLSPVNYEVELVNSVGRAPKRDIVHISRLKASPQREEPHNPYLTDTQQNNGAQPLQGERRVTRAYAKAHKIPL